MKCPIDATDLVMSERQGVEIDYCPQCRGVWLERGELDKIIDRSAELNAIAGGATGAAAGPVPPVPPVPAGAPAPGGYGQPQPYRGDGYRDDRDDRYRDQRDDRYRGDDRYRDQYGRPYRKKKESWLGELFDF